MVPLTKRFVALYGFLHFLALFFLFPSSFRSFLFLGFSVLAYGNLQQHSSDPVHSRPSCSYQPSPLPEVACPTRVREIARNEKHVQHNTSHERVASLAELYSRHRKGD